MITIMRVTFLMKSLKDPILQQIILHLLKEYLLSTEPVKTIAQSSLHTMLDGILYYVGQTDRQTPLQEKLHLAEKA